MKNKLHPATPGIARWLTETRKNAAVIGSANPGISDICEMLLPFIHGLAAVKLMTDDDIAAAIEEIENTMTPEEFLAAQKHAENEFLKFAASAVTPKKPDQRAGLLARIRSAFSPR